MNNDAERDYAEETSNKRLMEEDFDIEVGKIYVIALNGSPFYAPMKVSDYWSEKDEYLVESLVSCKGYFVKSHQMKIRPYEGGNDDESST